MDLIAAYYQNWSWPLFGLAAAFITPAVVLGIWLGRFLVKPDFKDATHEKLVVTEQVKLRATFLNTVAAGLIATGIIGPIATYMYGTTAQTARPDSFIVIEIAMLSTSGIVLHLLAKAMLRRLPS